MGGPSDDTPSAAPADDLLDTSFKAGFIHIYLLGLAIILAGPLGDWNYGFISGFWSYFLEFMIISIGYFLLISCLAEMTSIVAFASGAYGYVRCSVGPFYGFMVAVCEVMQNSFVAITCIYAVSDAITVMSGLSPNYEPLWMFLCYLCLFLLQCRGGWYFWTAMCIFAVTSALLVVLYCLSVLVSPDPAHANLVDESHEKFSRGGSRFMANLYRPIWLYIGAETVTISGKNIANGPAVIPYALLSVLATIFVLNVWVIFMTVVDYEAGDWQSLITDPLPFGAVFERQLGLSYRASAAFAIAPNVASALGFLYAAMHLTQAMSLSGLASPFFQPTVGEAKVPMRSLVANCVGQYAVLVIGWAASDAPPFFALCVIAACVVYVGVFAAYLTFHYKYASMERKFRSPFGVAGAWVGIAIFAVTFGVVAVSQVEHYVVYVFVAVMAAAGLYYAYVVEARQFFSPEEQRRFMKAYILNANKKKKAASSSLSRILERVGLASAASRSVNRSLSVNTAATSKATTKAATAKGGPAAASPPLKRNQVQPAEPVGSSPAPPQPTDAAAAVSLPAADDSDADEETGAGAKEAAVLDATPTASGHSAAAQQAEVQAVWSGKVMDAASSQKFLKFITSGPPTSTRSSLLAAGSFKASAKRTLLGGRSSKTQDEALATVADADEAAAEDNVLAQLREEFPDQVVVLPVSVTAASQPV